MSQLPDRNRMEARSELRRNGAANHSFWLSGIGGFVLGALTVIIVLLLTRRAGDRDEPSPVARPAPAAVQDHTGPNDAGQSEAAQDNAAHSETPVEGAVR